MADAVPDVFADGGILLAEAGTGTGKTLAYLVPAILSRQRVLVSTGTKNLQEQIFFKDLPVLREALGIPFTATYMKGRGNYLCLHRFDAYRDGTANSGFRQVDSGFGRPRTRRCSSASSTSGAAAPRPATGQRSRICPRISRSGRMSPRPPRTASAPNARSYQRMLHHQDAAARC